MKKELWSPSERRLFARLNTPFKIQTYLDQLRYNIDKITRSPRCVIQARRAHCFDGALFAAAALEFHGCEPLLMDLRCNGQDDDHVLALFKVGQGWGAIGKSNYVGCRYRDPVYRSLRELAMSYFHIYFNLASVKTLREYSVAFPLNKINDIDWRRTDEDVTPLGYRLDDSRHYFLISKRQEKLLENTDPRTLKAETLGLDRRGAFKV
jgi:hypothetical protein